MIMKKGLLFLLAIFSIGIARAQVEVTDVSGMDYAVYFDNPVVRPGEEATIPLYLKTKWAVKGVQGNWDFPSDLIAVVEDQDQIRTGGLNPNRFDKNSSSYQLDIFAVNRTTFASTVVEEKGIFAGDDILGYVKITVNPDMPLGEYAITIHDVKIGGVLTDGSEVVEDFWLDPIVCKITVTDAVDLYDTATEIPVAAENTNVVVHRTIKGGEWSTICLPFAMDANQIAEAFGSAEIADFASWTSESDDTYDVAGITLEFNSVDAMEANHPYIIKVGSDIESFRVDGVTIEPEEAPEFVVGKAKTKGTFYGTYTTTVVPEENLFLSGNKFWYSVGTTNMKGFRGYFELRDVLDAYYEEAPVKINLTVDGTTAISNIDLVKSNNEIFSVNGIKMGNDMNRLNKGIYIVNGKKIVK